MEYREELRKRNGRTLEKEEQITDTADSACPHCGASISPESDFCSACAKKIYINYSKEEAIDILEGANARDATRTLAAQLMAAKLNRLSGAYQNFRCCGRSVDIDEVIENTDEFLMEYPLGSNPQDEKRQNALQLKDLFDAYNNSECDWSVCSVA